MQVADKLFIIYNWGKKLKNLRFVTRAFCPTCKKDVDAPVSAVYKFFSLFFLPIIAFGTKHIGKCSECGSEIELDKKKLVGRTLGNAIPIWQRFGWVIMAGIIAIVILVINLASGPTVVSIAGRIKVSGGRSPSNYVVYVFESGERTSDRYSYVDEDGSYSFNNLSRGSYGIYICRISQFDESGTYTFEGPGYQHVFVHDGRTTNVLTVWVD